MRAADAGLDLESGGTMSRLALLEDVRVLSSLLEQRARAGVDDENVEERRSHIEQQITRLEEVAVKLERRLLDLEPDDFSPSEDDLFDAERAHIESRLRGLRQKIEALRGAAAEIPHRGSLAGPAPPGVKARLRRTLHELVSDMQSDPTVPRADVRPLQQRLAELVRERREDLRAVADRLEDARDYVVAALDGLGAVVESAVSLPDDTIGAGAVIPFPFEHERGLARTRIDMARDALREAHGDLGRVAHQWPELEDLAQREDWSRLPFRQLQQLIVPPDGTPTAKGPTSVNQAFGRRMLEVRDTARGLALWLDELRKSVSDSPPPA